MIQKIMIEVESPKPLKSCGNGHILLYNDSNKRYYVTTREEFLKPQNKKIADLEEDFKKLEQNNKKFFEEFQKVYSENVKTQKETNAKLIEMVNSVVVVEEK